MNAVTWFAVVAPPGTPAAMWPPLQKRSPTRWPCRT